MSEQPWPAPPGPRHESGLERDGMAQGSWYGATVATGGPTSAPTPIAARHDGPATTRPLWREGLELVLMTLAIAMGIQVAVQSRLVEGHSMEPTLHDQQRLLISRTAYSGYAEPQRGDIVVFHAWDSSEDYIKRVIGVPGDTVAVKGGKVFVNGAPVDEPYIRGETNGGSDSTVVLGRDDYYVMGDNRGNSADSRLHGALPRKAIVGKAWICYWPLTDLGLVSDSSTYAAAP